MTRTEALITLLNVLREDDIDTFADLYYLLAGDVGVSFDMAGCFYDLVDTEKLKVRIDELTDAGLREEFLIASLLDRLQFYIENLHQQALTAVRNNNQDLQDNPMNKPDVILNLARKTNDRLLSSEQEAKRLRFHDAFLTQKNRHFGKVQVAEWEQHDDA